MKIYPAIDLKSGLCVRLKQGNYDAVTTYPGDAITFAKSFAQQGATMIHIVDLDGALQGKSINLNIISKIAQETSLQVQTGGGIRTKAQIKNILDRGISRIVLGSIAILEPQLVKEWLQEFSADRFVLALDVKMNNHNEPKLALHGWQTPSEKNLWELLDDYQDSLLKHVLCTDILRDGLLSGPNVSLYEECTRRYPELYFQASGGVSALDDLKKLAATSIAGVVIGKALYENKFTLQSALKEINPC